MKNLRHVASPRQERWLRKHSSLAVNLFQTGFQNAHCGSDDGSLAQQPKIFSLPRLRGFEQLHARRDKAASGYGVRTEFVSLLFEFGSSQITVAVADATALARHATSHRVTRHRQHDSDASAKLERRSVMLVLYSHSNGLIVHLNSSTLLLEEAAWYGRRYSICSDSLSLDRLIRERHVAEVDLDALHGGADLGRGHASIDQQTRLAHAFSYACMYRIVTASLFARNVHCAHTILLLEGGAEAEAFTFW